MAIDAPVLYNDALATLPGHEILEASVKWIGHINFVSSREFGSRPIILERPVCIFGHLG